MDVDEDDLLLSEEREPVYDYNHDPHDYVDDEEDEDFDDEDSDDEDSEDDFISEDAYIVDYEITQYHLVGVRIESDNLLFCVQETFIGDDKPVCVNVKEVSGDEIGVSALEVCARILSDEAKDNILWKI